MSRLAARAGRLSRRQLLEAAGAAALAGAVSSISPALPRRRFAGDLDGFLPRVGEMRQTLHARVRPWALHVSDAAIARGGDGHTYAVDVGQLMHHFAVAGDLPPYLALRDFAAQRLIVDQPDDPGTRGFVLWRYNPGLAPDASGTTEALRIAQALWAGASAFTRPEDAELALVVLNGYASHQATDKGIWLIRNYFNFGTRSFATNSFIIDYDADFVARVAVECRSGHPARAAALADIAAKSFTVMRQAVAPCGLVYDLLQPELKTMYYDMDIAYFSPNDIIQINNACTTAATCAIGAPEVGLGVLGFALPQIDDLKVYYAGQTGDSVAAPGVRLRQRRCGAPELASLARLASLLHHRSAAAAFTEKGLSFWETIISRPDPGDAWMLSEILIALGALLDLGG